MDLTFMNKFKPETRCIKEFKYWIVCVRPKQVTIGEKRKLKQSLARIVEVECKSLELQEKQQTLFEYMDTISTDVSFEEMAEIILSRYSTTFPIEYSQTDIYVFILLVIKRWECGLNE